jgi:cardiolipin synthase
VRHTKSLTVDGAMSVFGSVNLDMRSLWLNFEISAFVYDDAFTGRPRSRQSRPAVLGLIAPERRSPC